MADLEMETIQAKQEEELIRRKQEQLRATQPQQQGPGLLEQFGRGAIKQLPTIGAIFGGAAGTGLTGMNPLGGVAGAGLGAGAGEAIKNFVEPMVGWEEPKSTIELFYDPMKEAIMGSTAQMGGEILGKGLELGLKAAPKVTQGARDLLKEGFPITRGTGIEKVAQKIPPGSWFFKKWQGKLNDMVNNSNKQFMEDLDLPSPKLRVSTGIKKDALFDSIETLVGGPKSLHKAPDLYDFASDNMDIIKTLSKSEGAILGKLVKQIETQGTVEYEVLRDITKNLSSTYGSKPINQKIYFQLKEAIAKDLERIGNATGNVQLLDLYNQAIGLGKNIHEMKNTQFVESLFRMKRATMDIENGQTKVFNPIQFKENVVNNFDLLKKMFKDKPEVPEMILEYANKMINAADDLSAFAKGAKGPGMVEKAAGSILSGTAGIPAIMGGVSKAIPVAVPWGFETIMAKSLANPQGWLKKFLFREGAGALPKLGSTMTKIGAMQIQPYAGD